MQVYGTGVDIVEVERVERAIRRLGDRFLNRVYTPAELAYCAPEPHRYRRLAARFAAKEAVLKALGIGLREVRWNQVEIERDRLGKPHVRLSGRVAEIASARGVAEVHVSISHSRLYGVAQAIALRDGRDGGASGEATRGG